jgi:signal transduction histidine kinase
LEQTLQSRLYFFNDRGEELSGRKPPPTAQKLAARSRQSGKAGTPFSFSGPWHAHAILTAGGRHYVLVSQGKHPLQLSALALRLIVVFITAGIVCYGLARYLTAPVIRLRRAAQSLAGGDLAARVGSGAGRRRDELTDLGHDFDLMAERIESLISAQRRLFLDLSHELRSPLARLHVALGLARQRTGPEASDPLNRIEREADRLNGLITQVLTLARLEADTSQKASIRVDLSRLVQEVSWDADFEARSHGRVVRVITCEDCTIIGNPELLRSALENVVRNAVRYTAEGTEVEIALRRLTNNGHSQAVITVRDHGEGVPEDSLAYLFRPFYRVAEARDRQTGGIGLGLAITERALRVHSGTVKAANAPDGGLVVEAFLPLAPQCGLGDSIV